jgi:transposase
MSKISTLYETDYATWARLQSELLRSGRYSELDVEHLLEELSDMGKSERRELESRLLILIAHLLKWQYQHQTLSERWREFKGDSWRDTIVEQRKQLAVLLRQSPGLKSVFAETILAAYPDALDLASKETRLPPETFPAHCPYATEQLLKDDFYPVSAEKRQDEDRL